jgi:hypothetical protein
MKPQVVDDFIDWVKRTYGTYGEVKVTRGTFYTYLGMTLDYNEPGQEIILVVKEIYFRLDAT